jgi:hypothetical protein
MQLLVQWLYTQKVEFDLLPPVAVSDTTYEDYKRKFTLNLRLAVRLWVLADMLIIPQLQNDMSDYIYTAHGQGLIATHCLTIVYENTLAGSRLRRLFVMICARYLGDENYRNFPESYPAEMFPELVQQYAKYRHVVITQTTESKETFHVARNLPP